MGHYIYPLAVLGPARVVTVTLQICSSAFRRHMPGQPGTDTQTNGRRRSASGQTLARSLL